MHNELSSEVFEIDQMIVISVPYEQIANLWEPDAVFDLAVGNHILISLSDLQI